jgi:trehalose/maltose transport system permease protein
MREVGMSAPRSESLGHHNSSSPAPFHPQGVARVFGGLFVLIGIALIAGLIVTIARDAGVRAALEGTPTAAGRPPSLAMAFLAQFGILMPILVIGLGMLVIRLGWQLGTRDLVAARWANVMLAWLSIGSFLMALFNLITAWRESPTSDAATQPTVLMIALLAGVLFALAFFWFNRNIHRFFAGRESLASRETRLAWTLLIPTLAVFVMVAVRPVEQTFIRSLTDKRFASREVPNFVGLENYRKLLGVRFDVLPCQWDDAAGRCATRPDGSIRWRSLDRQAMEEGYRTVWNLALPLADPPQALAISSLDRDFIESMTTTLVFAAISVSLELVLALFMALSVHAEYAGRGLMRAVMLIPWAIPTVVSARLWQLMLKDTSAGIINRVLMDLGVISAPLAWLSTASLQLPAAIMVDVWKTTPFMALLLLAGLQAISNDLYEAAQVDGASRLEQLWYITLPLLRPTIAVALVFRTLDALRVFDLFNVLFGRRQLSMATYNYETLVNNQLDGYASAVSIVLFILISIFAVLYVRMLNVETE